MTMQLVLDVIDGPHRGQKFTLEGHDNFIVGRAKCAHFRLPKRDPYFSRIHFMIEANPPQCRLVDSGSTNGTYVNGRRVESADLAHGDLIRGGDTVLKVSLIHGGESPPPELPVAPPPGLPEVSAVPPCLDEESDGLPLIDGYRVIRELGRGGMGTVYLASRMADGADVAIKTVRPAVGASATREVQRFLREADILRRVRHPKIVTFHEMGQALDFLYFVMDFVPGTDAARLLGRDGPIPIDRAVRLACDALEALDHAHARGFVHRDVKLANLLITVEDRREVCKLADFGLARMYHATSMSGLTIMGDTGGTVPYMPPEQITDYRNVSPAADQYALAATLYRLITGRFLFDFDKLPKTKQLTIILLDAPVPIRRRRRDVPEALAKVIHRALEKEPKNRYPSAAAFRQALTPFQTLCPQTGE